MSIIHITLYALGALCLIGVFVLTVATIAAYAGPRIGRISRGELSPATIAECCPPGLGCNDPHSGSRKCLRLEARRIGKVAELSELERSWSEFCGTPRRNKTERAEKASAYGAVRDGIIARALSDVADRIDAGRQAQLPAHLPLGTPGEVVPENNDRTRPESFHPEMWR